MARILAAYKSHTHTDRTCFLFGKAHGALTVQEASVTCQCGEWRMRFDRGANSNFQKFHKAIFFLLEKRVQLIR